MAWVFHERQNPTRLSEEVFITVVGITVRCINSVEKDVIKISPIVLTKYLLLLLGQMVSPMDKAKTIS